MADQNWWASAPVVDAPPQDAWWTSAPMAQPAPSANVAPASRMERFLTGAGDMLHGGAQLLVNSLSTGAVDAVNDATAWVNRQPGIGPVTQALRMTPATREQVNQGVQQREADYQASMRAAGNDPNATDWYRVGGNVAASVPLAAAGPVPASLRGAIGIGAAQGAVMSAATPVTDPAADFWDEKTRQAGLGAVTGGVGGAASYGLGRLLTGSQSASPQVRALHDAGVEMTPGQIRGGATQRMEDRLSSVPFFGENIRGAQRQSVESFNRAVANEVLQPIGSSVPRTAEAGRSLVQSVDDQISAAYNRALPRIQPFGPDAQFYQDLQGVSHNFLTPSARDEFQRFLRDNILSRTNGGQIDGQTWKRIDETLGRFVREYRGSLDPAQREMGGAAQGVQRAFRDLLGRVAPAEAGEVRAANEAFARFIRMENAAGRQGATDGVFSPQQMDAAVRVTDRSARRGDYARGEALMQELSDAGRAVLPSTVPNSGTPERMMLAQLLSGGALGAGVGATGAGMVPAAIAGGVGAGVYSGMGRRAIQAALLAQRPGAVQAAGNALVSAGAPVALPLGAMLLSPPDRLDQRR